MRLFIEYVKLAPRRNLIFPLLCCGRIWSCYMLLVFFEKFFPSLSILGPCIELKPCDFLYHIIYMFFSQNNGLIDTLTIWRLRHWNNQATLGGFWSRWPSTSWRTCMFGLPSRLPCTWSTWSSATVKKVPRSCWWRMTQRRQRKWSVSCSFGHCQQVLAWNVWMWIMRDPSFWGLPKISPCQWQSSEVCAAAVVVAHLEGWSVNWPWTLNLYWTLNPTPMISHVLSPKSLELYRCAPGSQGETGPEWSLQALPPDLSSLKLSATSCCKNWAKCELFKIFKSHKNFTRPGQHAKFEPFFGCSLLGKKTEQTSGWKVMRKYMNYSADSRREVAFFFRSPWWLTNALSPEGWPKTEFVWSCLIVWSALFFFFGKQTCT